MPLRLALLLTALLILPSMVLGDGKSIKGMSSYQDMARQCGEGPSQRSYSSSEYTDAIGAAQRALTNAGNNKGQRSAVKHWLDRLKECQAADARKITIPPIRNCDELFREWDNFGARGYRLYIKKMVTDDEYNRARELFREPTKRCVRDVLSKCVDPTKPSEVNRAINAMHMAAAFDLITFSKNLTGIDRLLADANPDRHKLRFCTETDYACKGNSGPCRLRVRVIKDVMEYYYIE